MFSLYVYIRFLTARRLAQTNGTGMLTLCSRCSLRNFVNSTPNGANSLLATLEFAVLVFQGAFFSIVEGHIYI